MIGTLNINGVDYVVIPRAEYEGRYPNLPPKDARGERPAKSAVQAVIARSLIRRRTQAGLDQKQLATLAGVRAETISRIESGRYRPRRETVLRLDQALASTPRPSKSPQPPVIPSRERWLHATPEAKAAVLRGLAQAKTRRFA